MSIALDDLFAVLAAVVLAAVGGEAFLKSILGAAIHLRVPKRVVAVTLAAFATSSPELTVSSVAALAGQPQIGLGDALGSNVVNIALIFGLALLYGACPPAVTTSGAITTSPWRCPCSPWCSPSTGSSRAEAAADRGLRRLAGRDPPSGPARARRAGGAGRRRAVGGAQPHPRHGRPRGADRAGRLFVGGATGIASAFAVDTYVVGVVLVAIGTSLPELVTVLPSRLRGHDDVGVGTLIGSNLFNGLAIVGVAGVIHPISAPLTEVALTLACGIAALSCCGPTAAASSGGRGACCLLYAGFVWLTLTA
jgi:cation:H+ antiporter